MQQKSLNVLLSEAWQLYTKKFNVFLVLILVLAVPFILISDLTLPAQQSWLNFTPNSSLEPFRWTALTGIGIAAQVIGSFVSLIITIGVLLAITKEEKKESYTAQSLIQEGAGLWFRVFATSLVMLIALIPLFFLLIIPGLIFSVYWMFAVPVVVILGKTYWQAMKHSYSLVRGRWFQVFGRTLVVGLIIGVITVVLTSVTSPIITIPLVETITVAIVQIIAVYYTIFNGLYFMDLQRLKQQESSEQK